MIHELTARHKTGLYSSRVSVISWDIKCAFDRLDHRRVKYHLSTVGIPQVLCKALSSFLDGRTAQIRIGGVTGPYFPLNAGTPQGPSPSAKLYTLVTRKAPIGLTMYHYYPSYADDCIQVIITQGTSIKMYGKQITRAIETQNDFEFRE